MFSDFRLTELDTDLTEGLVTEKGYWKKKLRLLKELMTQDDICAVDQLDADIKDDVITEVSRKSGVSVLKWRLL